ncbi:hypothetical protein C1646_773705 [Rhizophagus diaphanus]|nr:hypothetical protein C1646_773705 [Rhizophagus diaphanus] [Rhizophagus sp. MUCL 43196]
MKSATLMKLIKNNGKEFQRNGNLETQLEYLTKQNALLEDEASTYQSALGVVTNFDDDQIMLNNIFVCFTLFEQKGKHEADIVKNETLLSELLAHTSKCRAGDDEITCIGTTKLRQQIYSILSNRGFANVIDNEGENDEHSFINSLNKVMNQLRTINDNEKTIITENLAATIISNDHDDDGDDADVDTYVDLCYFPQIGKDLNTKNPKTYALAKVIARNFQYDNQILENIPQQSENQDQEPSTHKQKTNSQDQDQEQQIQCRVFFRFQGLLIG